MKEEDVNQTPAETTVETAPSAVEATDASSEGQETEKIAEETSADTLVEPAKVSESVPYDRFAEVNTKAKQLAEENETLKSYLQQQAPAVPETPGVEFDSDTKSAIQAEINQGIVNHKIAEFKTKHGDELGKDEILSIAVEREMRRQSSQGLTIDPNLAYDNAKVSLSKLVQPQVEQAKEEGVKEGQDIAKTKQQLGAVGESGKQEDVSDDGLSASELKKKYNIPVSN